MKGKKKIFSWLMFLRIAFVLCGLFFVLSSFEMVSVIEASRHWPRVEGQVISSAVERRPVFLTPRFGEECLARIWFSYDVSGNKYVSQNFRFDQGFSRNCEAAGELVGQYPAGRKVPVSYAPDSPDMGVIDSSNPPFADFVFMGIGFLAILFGGVALLGGMARGHKEK